MKSRLGTQLAIQVISLLLASAPLASIAIAQSTGGGGKGSTGGGGKGPSGASQGDQSATAQSPSQSPSPSGRIESTMLSYEASEQIAAYIAHRVEGYRIFIYDSQTFATLQTYDAYAATVSAFEMSFRM